MLNHKLQEKETERDGIEQTAQELSRLYHTEQNIRNTLETYHADLSFLEAELSSLEQAYHHLENDEDLGLKVKVACLYHDLSGSKQKVEGQIKKIEQLYSNTLAGLESARKGLVSVQLSSSKEKDYQNELEGQLQKAAGEYSAMEQRINNIDQKITANYHDNNVLLSLY